MSQNIKFRHQHFLYKKIIRNKNQEILRKLRIKCINLENASIVNNNPKKLKLYICTEKEREKTHTPNHDMQS